MALTAYLNEVKRLLHDSNNRFWSNTQLTDYINTARNRVASDTACLRSLEDVVLVLDTETYALSSFTTKTTRAYDIMNLTVIWGSQRIPMLQCAWTEFNARFRAWVSNTQRPQVWSRYGESPAIAQIYVQPLPDQDYDAQADIIYLPTPLVDDSTVDELGYPYTDPVCYWAAYLAKFNQQAYGEAEVFKGQYVQSASMAVQSFVRRLG